MPFFELTDTQLSVKFMYFANATLFRPNFKNPAAENSSQLYF